MNCPSCKTVIMHKAGSAISGKRLVQNYRCPKCYRKHIDSKENYKKEGRKMNNTVNVRGYGSFFNALGNQTRSMKPEIGMGVTELCYSDRHPYTVTAILSTKKIQVKGDIATRIDKNGFSECQHYDYKTDEESQPITLFLNKFGRWKRQGDPQGATYLIGKREEYYDFTR